MNRAETLSLLPENCLRERLNSLHAEQAAIIYKKNRLTEAEDRTKRAMRRLESEIALRGNGSKTHPV